MIEAAWIIARKEMLDGWRDRRSLGAALVFLMLGPALMGFTLRILKPEPPLDAPVELAVEGAERAPGLLQFLERSGARLLPPPADLEAAVRDGSLDVALRLPAGSSDRLRQWRPARLLLISDPARAASREAARRVEARLAALNSRLARERLLARGVSAELLAPLQIEAVDLTPPRARAAVVLAMLPVFLLVAAFLGGMNLAIDGTSGERERGSLEPLLLNPVGSGAIVLGKGLAIALFNGLGLLLAWAAGLAALGGPALAALEPLGALGLLAVALPVAALAAAAQLLAALFARSFKEGQTYLSLLLFAPMLPGLLLALRPMDGAAWLACVPVLSQQRLLEALLRGEAAGPVGWCMATATTLGLAAICLAGAARLLSSEGLRLER